MQELKFRAWDTDLNTYVYFTLGRLLPTGEELEEYTKLSTRGVRWEQFTGLYDRNNKEIYVGDLLRLGGAKSCKDGRSYLPIGNADMKLEVFFDEGKFTTTEADLVDILHWHDSEVVGNIQNIELLRK